MRLRALLIATLYASACGDTCPSGTSRAPDGECREACVPENSLDGVTGEPYGTTGCVDGYVYECSELSEADAPCTECGCPSGSWCMCDGRACVESSRFPATEGVCIPQLALGEFCREHWECESDNCSYRNRCQLPEGSRCTADDCDTCAGEGSDTYCAKMCLGTRSCDSGACFYDSSPQVCALERCESTTCPPNHQCVSYVDERRVARDFCMPTSFL